MNGSKHRKLRRSARIVALAGCALLLAGVLASGRAEDEGKRRLVDDLIGQHRATETTRRPALDLAPPPSDRAQRNFSPMIQAALNWLVGAQNPSGSWGGAQELIETATVVETLAAIDPGSAALTAGASWLSGESPTNHEFLARQLIALDAAPGFNQQTAGIAADLISARNAIVADPALPNWPEGGWGVAPGFESDCLTTAVAISALERSDNADPGIISQPITYIVQSQNPDGGWGLQRGQPTLLYTTLHVILALLDHGEPAVQTVLDNSLTYLRSVQAPDGSFGFGGPPVPYVTALAALSLIRSEAYPFSLETEDAVAALAALQDIDGSWDQQAYDTALAALAHWEHNQTPSVDAGADQTLIDADDDGLQQVQLTGSATDADGTIQSYEWTENGVVLASDPSPTLSLDVSEHILVLTATDDLGKTGSDTVVVTVEAPGPDGDLDGLSDSIENLITLTDPASDDTDGDGIPDGSEDFDFDGRLNDQEVQEGTSPFDPDVFLTRGLNLFAYPVEVPGGLTATTLLDQLAVDAAVVSIGRLDAAGQTIETAVYQGGGADFPITNEEGYLLRVAADAHLVFSGIPSCPTHSLQPGVNLIGFPCTPAGFTQAELLYHFGDETQVASVHVFDGSTGRYLSAVLSGLFAFGSREPIHAGRGILVDMSVASGAVPAPIAAPTVQITSPADGATVMASPATLLGTVDDPLASVRVNGILASVDPGGNFSADVPLALGSNDIEAVARSANNLAASDMIQVTFDPTPIADYTLGRPDSVTDSRSFNVGPGTLNNLNDIQLTGANIPPGLTYTAMALTINPATGDVTAPFTISTAVDALVGVHTFQITYLFLDAGAGLLASQELEFTVEILP